MQPLYLTYFLTFLLSFCSIVYELILAQALTAFLENTILRYSVTIGLYMCSMGFGSLLVGERLRRCPTVALLRVETFLTALGGFVIILLHLLDLAHPARFIFNSSAYLLIVAIGLLTGMEVPLLIEMANARNKNSENTILAINYAGALAGTFVFAFLFYPAVGLMSSSFFVAFLNSIAGLLLFTQRDSLPIRERQTFRMFLSFQLCLFLCISVCLFYSTVIQDYFIRKYIGSI